jgi:CRP-like cAMP-binding protein
MERAELSSYLEHPVTRDAAHPGRLGRAHPAPLPWARDAVSLFPHAIRRWYSKGEWIGRDARPETALYVVLEGRVGLLMQDSDGRQALLSASGRTGVIAAAETRSRGHAVRMLAQSRSLVMHVCFRDLEAALASNARNAAFIVSALTLRLVDANAQLASLAFDGVRARVADTLLECAREQDGAWVVADCGSEEIARRVAASREMVSRVLGRMIGEGLVRRHKRKTIILDREGLAGAAGERGRHL